MSKIKPIPRTLYIASHKPQECVSLLYSCGISSINSDDTNSIARGLTHLIQSGNEDYAAKVIDLHPDQNMILTKAKKFDKFVYADDVKETKEEIKPIIENIPPPVVNEHIISKDTAHLLIGATLSLATVLTIVVLVKNIK